MPDTTTPAAPKVVRRQDYAPPAFLVDRIDLDFDLGEEEARVGARLAVRRNPAAPAGDGALALDGEGPELRAVRLDGRPLRPSEYRLEAARLVLPQVPAQFVLETEVAIRPQDNTALSGLYKSDGIFCTQCEAEGFRRITYFPDRPDVMARYTATIRAERARYPVLLANGNPVASGDLGGGRHFVRWEDPFPKPSYLFALVAGDLACLEDVFVTRSGRRVALRIYSHRADIAKCGHAMASLKKAMRWDEEVYGLEYDLDIFMIVAVGDFNFGAMENKGLNIFNTKYILAAPETATDQDHANVESVVAHEYFHNWTGNRITCRDWFQLSLKEGLTVFREQQFTADVQSAAVTRINEVRQLRARQFPEDAGPMAHPVRPDSYITIDNFYTPTVYEKGAEVIRMMRTLLGPDLYRKGMDLYVQRHDGQAVTCDDFVAAMEAASGMDLGRFRLWYSQAGTPELSADIAWDEAGRALTLTVEQRVPPTPGQPDKEPMPMPLAVGLIDRDGQELAVQLAGEPIPNAGGTRVLLLSEARQSFTFVNLPTRPAVSLLRGFSAPVKLRVERSDEELQHLMAHDTDPVARWDAGQDYALKTILRLVADRRAGRPLELGPGLVTAFAQTLNDVADKAFAALALTLPGEEYVGEHMAVVDVDGIHEAREFVRARLGATLAERWRRVYEDCRDDGPYRFTPEAVGRRSLKNLALGYLLAAGHPDGQGLCLQQLARGANMTDSLAALANLDRVDATARAEALNAFYDRWRQEALVLDKWFAAQATYALPDTLDRVEALLAHPAFDYRNPNKVYALIGAFAGGNPVAFHRHDGRGYRFLADQVLKIDPLNPQVAARILGPLIRWRRHDESRQALMRAELERIVRAPGVSKNVYEIAAKGLG
ncbi:MAG: aminopeptidase N [Rhodospirillaceae bacterium]|nr:aminopeptidase N [Rhodospirillaceae bacterium]